MRLPEDDPKYGLKHVATIKLNQCEQFYWFILIYCCFDSQIPSINQ
jgi:hypothetical protein